MGFGTLQYTTTRDGVTWSHPRTILTQNSDGMIPKVISNQMIVHSSGAWILPYWREQPRQGSKACTPVCTCTCAPHPPASLYLSRATGPSTGAEYACHLRPSAERLSLQEKSLPTASSVLISHNKGKTWVVRGPKT